MELEALRSGNDTGNTLWINQENMYIVDETQIQNIYNKVNGLQANSFEGMTIIDPALDVGDKIIINGKTVIYQGGLDFQGRFIANIKSKIALKQKQETTVKQISQKVINRRVESNINQIEGKITQLVEENTETSNKLTLHEQTIDSMKDTLKSQETKIETVETKANTAQSTANTANTTANNAKTKADSNATKIQTTTTKLTEVEKTVDGITQSVSSVEEKVETVGSTANNAKTSAENANSKIDNLQVGGRNFLTNTATEKSINVNKTSGYVTFDPYSTDKKKKLSELGLKVGDKVTISFNWKISKNSSLDNVYGNFRLEWLGVNETSQSAYLGAIKNPAGTFSASNTTGKITVTIALTATTVNAHTVRIRIDNSVLTFTVSNMKLEAGNMATDWTPAPEDIENNLSSNYYTKIEADSQIQQKADSITTSVNKKITEIQVDADNLLLNTALKKDTSNFSLASGVARVTDKLTPNNNYCFKYNISGLTADAWRSANPTTVELNAGEIVTASANVYVPSGVTNSSIRLEIQYFNASNSRISVKMAPFVDLTKTNQWQRTYITDTAPAGTVKANARVWILRNGQCWVGDLKLGRGNTVTSWCPSSKDYLTEKEARSLITQTADSINLEVSKKVGNNEIISKINQSAETVGIDATKISLSASDILNLLAGNTINLTSKNIVISADKFSVDKNGKVTCSDMNITSGKISLQDGTHNNANLAVKSSSNNKIKTVVTPRRYLYR